MFNSRIEYTKERVNASVSVPSIFTVLENTTAETAQIESLAIERLGDSVFDVEAMMRTDTFDSSLFQREFYEQESTINDLALTDLTIETQGDEESENPTETFITFNAMLAVPVSSVPLTADMLTEPVSASVENEIIVDEIATSTDDSLGTNPDSV
jgi:hypothetical protein